MSLPVRLERLGRIGAVGLPRCDAGSGQARETLNEPAQHDRYQADERMTSSPVEVEL